MSEELGRALKPLLDKYPESKKFLEDLIDAADLAARYASECNYEGAYGAVEDIGRLIVEAEEPMIEGDRMQLYDTTSRFYSELSRILRESCGCK